MTHVSHDGEVVADEQHRGADVALQFEQQVDDLSLDGDVQRTDGLIADQELGAEDHGACNADPLALAAAEFVGITAHHVGSQANPLQHLSDPASARPCVQAGFENTQRLGDGLPHRHARIQACERILKDDLQVAAQWAQRRRLARQQVLAAPHDGTLARANQPQDGTCQRRLAGS